MIATNYVYIVVEDTTDFDPSENVVREFAMTLQGAKRIAKTHFGILIKSWKTKDYRGGERMWFAKRATPSGSHIGDVWIEKVMVSE